MKGALGLAIDGAEAAIRAAGERLDNAIRRLGQGASIGYPQTSYYLPFVYGLTGRKTTRLGELKAVLDEAERSVKKKPTVENALDAGLAFLMATEVAESIRYAVERDPYRPPYSGFMGDSMIREFSLPLATGDIPGIAVIIGRAKDDRSAATVGRDLQARNLLGLVAGPVVDQMMGAGVKMGARYKLIAIGSSLASGIHAINLLIRVPLMFAKIKAGRRGALLRYVKEKVPIFVVALGPADGTFAAAIAGAVALGVPVLTDQTAESALAKELSLFSQPAYSELVSAGCRLKGIKAEVVEVELPIDYGSIFEGERVRRGGMYVEFGGKKSTAFEYLRIRPMDEVEDGRVALVGPDLKDMEEGGSRPLGIIIDVAGRGMERDLEPVLERRIHQYVNFGHGLMHVGQRDIVWMRVSKEAVRRGFSLKDLGRIFHAMFHREFPKIVDRIQTTILTVPSDVDEAIAEARKAYAERDARVIGLTEEEADTFYGCTLCQSFAPSHVCVITPERTSLCGATSWLDAMVSHRIGTRAVFPVPKGECVDPVRGEWTGVNETVRKASHGAARRYCLHSMFECPPTSCGCFEAIAFFIPEVSGIGIVHREYTNPTPNGLTFSTMAGLTGGGKQLPGMIGIGIEYIKSKKFLQADGGLRRVVWMPRELKERVKDAIPPGLYEKIADETAATSLDELRSFLERSGHPVVELYWPKAGME